MGQCSKARVVFAPMRVRDQLLTIDADDADLIYTDEPTINPMTDDDLQDFQRDVVSTNG